MDNDKRILAVVTKEKDLVYGGIPIFYVSDPEEQVIIAHNLSRLLDGIVHELRNGSLVIIRH